MTSRTKCREPADGKGLSTSSSVALSGDEVEFFTWEMCRERKRARSSNSGSSL